MLGCPEFQRSLAFSRRDFLRAGLFGAAGIGLSDLLRAEPATGKRQNNVIILWMRGGPSHIDMWDPKPHAPEEYRGEFGTISSSVPGIH